MATTSHRTDSRRPRFSNRRAARDRARGAGTAARCAAGQDRRRHGADHRRAVDSGARRADGDADGLAGGCRRSTPDVLGKITETMAQLYRIVPIKFEDNMLTVATCDPQNLTIQDELRTFLGYDIAMVVATERDVMTTIDTALRQRIGKRRKAGRRAGRRRRTQSGDLGCWKPKSSTSPTPKRWPIRRRFANC